MSETQTETYTKAEFWKCALQVNPWTYAQQYQGQGAAHGLSEDDYNSAIADGCIKNEVQVVGIADHGSVDGVEKLRSALETKGIVVFPGFEIASTEKVHMVCLYPAGTTYFNEVLPRISGFHDAGSR